MILVDWYSVTLQALQSLWQNFLAFAPLLIVAIIIFIVGWFISVGIGRLVTEILKRLRFNQLFEKGAWKAALDKAEIKVDAAGFIGAIVKWVLVITLLVIVAEILRLPEFAGFLRSVLLYLPNVLVAVLIFVATVIVVDIVEKIVRAAVESIRVGYGRMVSVVVKWSIWIFAIAIILDQLNIGGILPEAVILGIIGALALGIGLAFGLGGKDVAAGILEDLRRKLKE